MRIEVSHESPIQFLNKSLEYNDYDYALVHLFERFPEYYEFYRDSVYDRNRKVYLDNSIFELGESFDESKYAKWIGKLNPTYYIVPDALEDANMTVNKFIGFIEQYDKNFTSCGHSTRLKPMTIGVVQGTDWYELTECYKFMSSMADMIAISFDYSYYLFTGTSNIINQRDTPSWYNLMYNPEYEGQFNNENVDPRTCNMCLDKVQRYKTGRQAFIQRLISEDIWNWNKPHHLLGCSLASEFSFYTNNNIHNIVSVDTSNPIVAALKGYNYQATAGLQFKPADKLADLIEFTCSTDEEPTYSKRIDYNTSMFKHIVGRY